MFSEMVILSLPLSLNMRNITPYYDSEALLSYPVRSGRVVCFISAPAPEMDVYTITKVDRGQDGQ
jgi:hypothetical protein